MKNLIGPLGRGRYDIASDTNSLEYGYEAKKRGMKGKISAGNYEIFEALHCASDGERLTDKMVDILDSCVTETLRRLGACGV